MRAHLELWKPSGPELVPLDGDRITLGKASSNDVSIGDDKAVSRMHASFERYGAGWSVRDLGSRNGTFVNGERVLAERQLHHGDEVRVGTTRLVYRTSEPAELTRTEAVEAPPEVTRREREVLLALCRPVMAGAMFSKPATIKQIAGELFVTEAAVKQHLSRLYDKFRVVAGDEPRPVQLANEAIRRGAVSIADLKGS